MATRAWKETWDRLYREAYPDIFRALVATLLDEEAAADAMHDAFLDGLNRPPPNEVNLRGWLFRVALRKARRAKRRASLLHPVALLFGLEAERRQRSEVDAVLDRVAVGRLLEILTERQRAVVVAYFYLGLRQEDIAEQLGIRRGTVASTLAHAIERMRKGESHVV
ncbi:MAG: RNA polymerase sigma factor [Candidatus Limnocylindria bacterium]